MKLRQKLAAVLAATMVVTAVPVVTMAASTSGVTKVVTTTNTDDALASNAPTLKIKLDDNLTGSEFFLRLEGAEWDADATTEGLIKVDGVELEFHRLDKSEVLVKVPAGVEVNATDTIEVSLANAIVKGDEAVVIVDGNQTEITDAKVVFARKAATKITATAADAPSFLTGTNDIAKITLSESIANELKPGATYTFDLELDTDEFEFTGATPVVTGTRGLAATAKDFVVTLTKDAKYGNEAVLTIEVPAGSRASSGALEITGIKVRNTVRNPQLTEINATLTGAKTDSVDASAIELDFVAANVTEYGSAFSVKEVKEVKAGKIDQEAKVTLKEVTADSFVGGTVDIEIEGGFFTEAPANWKAVPNKDGKIDTITRDLDSESGATSNIDKLLDETVVKFYTELGTEGDVVLTATGRAIGDDMELVIANVTSDFEVKAEAMNVEVGVKDQTGGKIEITEADKATFARGTKLVVELPVDSKLTVGKEVEVSATGEMKVSASDVLVAGDKNEYGVTSGSSYVVVTVDRASTEAATITLEDFELSTDRTIADGSYDAKVFVKEGSKLREGSVKVEDFIVIGEGIATKVTTKIQENATEMEVNGKKVALDAPAFIENGKLMVPLRAVAEAFGIASKDIVYNGGEIVIFANGRTVALTIGSTDAFVNGAKMTLANPAKLVNDRTTVPVGDLARLLGLSVEWDNTSKTATFKN